MEKNTSSIWSIFTPKILCGLILLVLSVIFGGETGSEGEEGTGNSSKYWLETGGKEEINGVSGKFALFVRTSRILFVELS